MAPSSLVDKNFPNNHYLTGFSYDGYLSQCTTILLSDQDIANGGVLVMEMGNWPSALGTQVRPASK
jgi:putative alpha-1,2-mannosidase